MPDPLVGDDAHDETHEFPGLANVKTLELPRVPYGEDRDSPTTMSIPIVGGASIVVVDEADAGTRSIEALKLSPLRAKIALFTLATAAFAAGANESSIVALSQTIASDLRVPVASIGLVVTAFALTIVAASTPLTLLTSKVSRRLTLSVTLGVWTLGVMLAATSTSLVQLTAGRIVSAAAHALFWALVAPTATSLFAPHLRARTVTRIMVGAAAAGVVGTPLVTLTGTSLGWQAPYWGLATLGLMLTIALAIVLPGKSKPARGRQQSPTRGDIPSGAVFAKVLAVAFLATVSMSVSWTYIVPIFTREVGLSVSSLPLLFALGGVMAVSATVAVTPLLTRNVVHTVRGALGVLAIAWVLLSLVTPWAAIAAQVLQAAGWAALLAALLNWAMRHTPWRTDVGASTYTVALSSGSALGPLLGASIVAAWGTRLLPLASLALTLAALAVTATIDTGTLGRLRVPRLLRQVVQSRFAINEKRLAWTQRTQGMSQPARGRAVAFTRGVARARRELDRAARTGHA